MEGFERSKGLIDEVLSVIVREVLGTNDTMHVSLHEFLNEIDLFKGIDGGWFDNVEDGDDLVDCQYPSLIVTSWMLTFSLTPASERNFNNLSSLKVRRQNME